MTRKITAYAKQKNTIPQPKERKFLDLPQTREGWSKGEWAGFYDGLRTREKNE